MLQVLDLPTGDQRGQRGKFRQHLIRLARIGIPRLCRGRPGPPRGRRPILSGGIAFGLRLHSSQARVLTDPLERYQPPASSPTIAFSSFNSLTETSILPRLNSLMGRPWTI